MSTAPEKKHAAKHVAAQPARASQCEVSNEAVKPDRSDNATQASAGDNSLSITPKDVSADDAASRDLVARHMNSCDPDEKQQEVLDDAIELSFPASDPPSVAGGITRIEKALPSSQSATP